MLAAGLFIGSKNELRLALFDYTSAYWWFEGPYRSAASPKSYCQCQTWPPRRAASFARPATTPHSRRRSCCSIRRLDSTGWVPTGELPNIGSRPIHDPYRPDFAMS